MFTFLLRAQNRKYNLKFFQPGVTWSRYRWRWRVRILDHQQEVGITYEKRSRIENKKMEANLNNNSCWLGKMRKKKMDKRSVFKPVGFCNCMKCELCTKSFYSDREREKGWRKMNHMSWKYSSSTLLARLRKISSVPSVRRMEMPLNVLGLVGSIFMLHVLALNLRCQWSSTCVQSAHQVWKQTE